MSIFEEPADVFELETERLVLRGWRESDVEPWIAMNADPDVRRYFPGLLSAEESVEAATRYQQTIATHGFGLYAVECRGHLPVLPRGESETNTDRSLPEDRAGFDPHVVFLEPGTFLGFIGLTPMNGAVPSLADGTAIEWEIGWRLRSEAWGQGLATEGAAAVLDYAFGIERFPTVGSYTTRENTPSIAVMKRIGLSHTADFINEALPDSHRECVLYSMTRDRWMRTLPAV